MFSDTQIKSSECFVCNLSCNDKMRNSLLDFTFGSIFLVLPRNPHRTSTSKMIPHKRHEPSLNSLTGKGKCIVVIYDTEASQCDDMAVQEPQAYRIKSDPEDVKNCTMTTSAEWHPAGVNTGTAGFLHRILREEATPKEKQNWNSHF